MKEKRVQLTAGYPFGRLRYILCIPGSGSTTKPSHLQNRWNGRHVRTRTSPLTDPCLEREEGHQRWCPRFSHSNCPRRRCTERKMMMERGFEGQRGLKRPSRTRHAKLTVCRAAVKCGVRMRLNWMFRCALPRAKTRSYFSFRLNFCAR